MSYNFTLKNSMKESAKEDNREKVINDFFDIQEKFFFKVFFFINLAFWFLISLMKLLGFISSSSVLGDWLSVIMPIFFVTTIAYILLRWLFWCLVLKFRENRFIKNLCFVIYFLLSFQVYSSLISTMLMVFFIYAFGTITV